MYRVAGFSREINASMAGNPLDAIWTVSQFITDKVMMI